jgi:hypothetical protein
MTPTPTEELRADLRALVRLRPDLAADFLLLAVVGLAAVVVPNDDDLPADLVALMLDRAGRRAA